MRMDANLMQMELIQADAIEYLKGYPFTGKELVCCDPPYLRETRRKDRRLYKYEYARDQHIELLEVIKAISCKVLISGYESLLYKESLKGWHAHVYQSGCHHGVAAEWLWMNYSSPVKLHDYRYLGNNCRDRERIKNKSKRWVARLESMPVLERKALLSVIQSVHEE